jgi:diguanylate cyclase (GGDEF)-like protein
MDPVADLLARAAATLAASDDLDASVGALLEVATTSLGSSFAAVTLQDTDRAGLQVAIASGVDDATREEFETTYVGPDGPVAQTAADRVARMGEDLIHLPLVVTRGGIEQLVGVLTLGRAGDSEPDDDERTTLAALAALTAVAVDRARLGSMIAERSEWFERMAHTDPLTGLANERTFGRILELELARAGRQGGEVSLAVFDVDDLTAVNESAGHAAGDDILRAVAAVLAESVRLVDTVARIGGDEFVLVAPGSAGITVAQRVLDGIAALPAEGGRPISVSAGVARFPIDGGTAEDLRAAAEAALTAARTAGGGTLAAPPAPATEG